MSAQSRQRSIDLLGQHHARQLVRKRHRRKRPQRAILFPPFRRQTARDADQKNQIARFLLGLAQQRSKLRRIERLPSRIEHQLASRWMLHPRIEPPSLHFPHLASHIMTGPLQIILGHRVGVRIARLADVVEENFQNCAAANPSKPGAKPGLAAPALLHPNPNTAYPTTATSPDSPSPKAASPSNADSPSQSH